MVFNGKFPLHSIKFREIVSGDGKGVVPSSKHELSDKSLFIALGLQILLVYSPLAVILDF